MTVLRKTISIRPLIWEMILKEAKRRDVTISRCIEDKFEFHQEEYVETYSLNEPKEGLKQI